MENSSHLDLEQRIAQWRESLSDRPSLRGEDVEELESHLRDTIEELNQTGLPIEEAFLIATRRAGSPSELESQFNTVNPTPIWRTRALWMITGVLLYWVLGSINGILSSVSMLIGSYLSLGNDVGVWGGFAIQLLFFVAFVATLLASSKRPELRARSFITLTGFLLAIVPILMAAQLGATVVATRSLPVEALGAQAISRMCWNFAQTIGIIGIGLVLFRAQRRALRVN